MKEWKLTNRGRLLASLSAAVLVGSALLAGSGAVAAPGGWTQAQVNTATTNGVNYIDSQCALNVDGHCGSSFPLSETGMALVAYSVEQAGVGGFASMPAAHQAHVKAAIQYLLINQAVDGSWADSGFFFTYSTGIDLAGLSAFTTVVPGVPAAITAGRNFLINLDWQGPPREGCSSGQFMPGNDFCGGWNYDTGLLRSDESNTGFAMFGLFLTGGVPAPIQVVNTGWQNNIQELTATNAQYAGGRNDGGGDYQPGVNFGSFSSNANDTGSMLFGYAYDAVLGIDPRVQAGLKFGQDVLDTYEKSLPGTRTGIYHTGAIEDGSCAVGSLGCDWSATFDGGYHYSLFSLTKGLGEYIPPVLSDPNNWYAKVVDLLLTEQNVNGSWPQDSRDDGTTLIATAFAVSALGLVAVEQPITNAAGVPFSATEGINKCAPVATFSDADSKAVAGDYTASIVWGDGTPIDNTATIAGNGSGNFTVSGCHKYAEEGPPPYTITVTITDADNATNNAIVTTSATVADAALASACAAPAVLPAGAFSGPTATFTDASSTGTLSDFSATIDWGDSTTSAGTITGGPGTAPYTVSGTHTYTKTGAIVITTTITDVGGSKTVATCNTSRTACGNDEHDGDGDIRDDNSNKHTSDNRDVKFHSDQDDDNQACDNEQEESGDSGDNDQKHVDEHDNRTGDDFHSTQVQSVQIESLANGKKGTITGVGIHNGNVVSFTAVEIDNGPGLPGFFSLVLSDGYNVAGSLVDGAISLG